MLNDHHKESEAAIQFRQGDIVTFQYHDFYKKSLSLNQSYGVVVTGDHILQNPGSSITVFPVLDQPAGFKSIPLLKRLDDIDLAMFDMTLPGGGHPAVPSGRYIRPDLALDINPDFAGAEGTGTVLPYPITQYSLDQFSRLLVPPYRPQELYYAECPYHDSGIVKRVPVIPLLPAELTRQTKIELSVRLYTNLAKQKPANVSVLSFDQPAFVRGDLGLASYYELYPRQGGSRSVARDKMWEVRSYILSHFGASKLPFMNDLSKLIASEKHKLDQPPRPLAELARSLKEAINHG